MRGRRTPALPPSAPLVLTSKKSTELAETKAGIRLLALTDTYALATMILGYVDMVQGFHGPLCRFLDTTPYQRNLYLCSRLHFKTSVITVARNVRRLLADPQIRILIASNKEDNAAAMLGEIQQKLLTPQLVWAFPEILHDDPDHQAERWTKTALTVKRTPRREATVEAIGISGEITSKHYDHGSLDDLVGKENSENRDSLLATIEWWKKSIALFEPHATQDIVGCLPGEARILMEDGLEKPLGAVKAGDRVWAADEDGTLEVRTVVARVPQGEAETVTIRTSAKTLRATANHPFLVCRAGALAWCPADQLQIGEYIVSIKSIPGAMEHPWMTEEFVWLFGFLMGDGWASIYLRPDGRNMSGHIGIALSLDEELNERVLRLAEEWLRGAPFCRTPLGYARSDAWHDAAALRELGLTGTAKTKRLPEWAFRLPPAHRRALLRGFCEADGHRQDPARSIDAWHVEIANRGLLEDLRQLASLCGVRTGALKSRTRMIRAPHSPAPVMSETCQSGFNFAAVDREEFYANVGGSAGGRRRLRPSAGLRPERVISITPAPMSELVYDLTIEGTPSFFANGLAVHNTPWHAMDLYGYLQERKRKHGMRLGVYRRACWENDAGEVPGVPDETTRPTFPERFSMAFLRELKQDMGTEVFSAQMLLNPEESETAVFDRRKIRPYILSRGEIVTATGGLERLWIAMTVDPAISTKAWADYTAIAVGGFDRDGILWILDLRRGRWAEDRTLHEIYDCWERTQGIRAIGFEAVGFAQIYRRLLVQEGEKRGYQLPISKLERDNKTKKNIRIRGLQPYWESGGIRIADDVPALDEFLEEASRFRTYKESEHDDLLDAVVDLYQLRLRPDAHRPDYLTGDAETDARVVFEAERLALTPDLDRASLRQAWLQQRHRDQRAQQAIRETIGADVGEAFLVG